MRSRAERARIAAEWLLRAASVALLAILLWRALQPADEPRSERLEVPAAEPDVLAAALARWAYEAPARAHLVLEAPPSASRRAWLRALDANGADITWSGDSLPALAIAAEPLADPRRLTRVAVAASRGSALVIADEVGVLDSLTIGGVGAAVVGEPLGRASVRSRGGVAVGATADSLVLRPLLLLARAGWEAKFAMAALEEHGWTVHARLSLGPGMEVRQGPPRALDTATYAAAIVLDSASVPDAGRLARYVRSGGGLVLLGDAPLAEALRGIAPARAGPRGRPPAAALASAVSPATLPRRPLVGLADGAVPLERRGGTVTVAARRLGAGRVVQAGYEESWRWRMAGGETAVDEHRLWWSRLVSAAAYAPLVERVARDAGVAGSPADTTPPDPAPLASLVSMLGAATPDDSADPAPAGPGTGDGMLFVLLVTFLLAEWASRRLRGAR